MKLLWIGDAACQSGFARVTHGVLDVLRERWDVAVLGINYLGDPHEYPYPIYPCFSGGDAFGIRRMPYVIGKVKPDVIVVQQDPWNFPQYLQVTQQVAATVPVVGMVAVDGLNCRGADMNGLALACFWTQFGADEARKGGYAGLSAVVPLGVDLDVFAPMDRRAARARIGMPERTKDGLHLLRDAFIVGNVNRNQQRKRLDLTIEYFAQWVSHYDVRDAYLMLHVAPTGDATGYDCLGLAKYFGVEKRVILRQPKPRVGPPDRDVAALYAAFDVQVSTTQGEGWGLCTMEGMACGVPQIVPRWAALGEWAVGAACMVGCSQISITPGGINSIGATPDRDQFISSLDMLYRDADARARYRERGLELVADPQYRWRAVGERFEAAMNEAISEWEPPADEPQQLEVARG